MITLTLHQGYVLTSQHIFMEKALLDQLLIISSTDIIMLVAEMTIISALIFRNILWLRFFMVLGSLSYVIGGLHAGLSEPGMKVIVFFSTVAACINLSQIVIILAEKKALLMPQEFKFMYHQLFSFMTAREFMKLIKVAGVKQRFFTKGDILVIQGQVVEDLMTIDSGSVAIKNNGKEINTLSKGFFIGEMAFLTEQPATASVIAVEDGWCFTWRINDLKKARDKHPELIEKLRSAIAINLVKKLTLYSLHH